MYANIRLFLKEQLARGCELKTKDKSITDRYVSQFYHVPRETRSYYGANFGRDYIRSLVNICKSEEVNWIVPIGDEDKTVLANKR